MPTTNDLQEIERVVQAYLDGLYEGDADKIASVFHPTSALTGTTDGKIVITPRDQWLAAVRTRPAPKAQGLERGDHVLVVDLLGPATAFVKVKCQIPPRYFTDLLSLLKVDGRWQIVQKVFQTETRGS